MSFIPKRFLGFFALLFLLFAIPVRAVIRDGGVDPANLGQGGWLYVLSSFTNKLGGTVPSVKDENTLFAYLKSVGYNYVIVKAATSNQVFNNGQFSTKLVNAAHANGLLIFGSNRSWGEDIPGEIAMVDYVFSKGADGFIWDAESEWESSRPAIGTNGPAKAWELCSTARAHWPNKFLAHNPYDTLYLHSSFPFREFGYWCDAVMPQVYHHTASQGSAVAAIHWTDVNYQLFQNSLSNMTPSVINGETIYWTNAIKPLTLMRDIYNTHPDRDVMEFLDYLVADPNCVTAGGYKGSDYFRSDLHTTGQWNYMKASTIGIFSNVVNNIIIDDANATVVGGWTKVRTIGATTGTVTFYGEQTDDVNTFGTNYWRKSQGNGSAYIQFRPKVLTAGDYNVYQWHPTRTDLSATVPFSISHAGGVTNVLANQQTNDAFWSFVGKFPFAAGTNGYVRILDSIGESDKVAVVDGLKMMFVAPTAVPATPTGLTASAFSTSSILLSWNDNATNETGYIISRSGVSGGPYVDIATTSMNATTYTNTALDSGINFYYVVRGVNYKGASGNSAQASTIIPGTPVPPVILQAPQSQVAIAGSNPTFTVVAGGTQPHSYQWFFNNALIKSATSTSFTMTNVQLSSAGSYFVVVTNVAGAVTSSVAGLTVKFSLTASANGAGTVSVNPSFGSYSANTSVTLTATPNASAIFTGWSGDASGLSNPLTISMTSNKTITANFAGGIVSDIVLDNTDAPHVTLSGSWQSGTQSLDKYGADYVFAAGTAGGSSNATYRPSIVTAGLYDVFVWYPQGSNRATNAQWGVFWNGGSQTVSVNQQVNGGKWVQIASAKNFAVGTNGYVRMINDIGTTGKVVVGDAVRFSYVHPPFIAAAPETQAVMVGSNVTFNATVTGAEPLVYQWRLNGLDLAGATDSALTVANVQTNQAGNYSLVITNTAGTATAFATLSVIVPPVQFQSNPVLSSNQLHLMLSGVPGTSYWIDRSTNLSEWEPVTNFVATNGPVEFIDGFSTNRDKSFYRLRK